MSKNGMPSQSYADEFIFIYYTKLTLCFHCGDMCTVQALMGHGGVRYYNNLYKDYKLWLLGSAPPSGSVVSKLGVYKKACSQINSMNYFSEQ
ncbi:hypothetical protein EV682_101560 [Iodobacter fluviatilis]|uniref:Uncharacterized protein n=1 Tax=Iodobacter fluviatilis TaxID=537 RepID=A0A377Q3P5_9NEIS|nr:hypothetical protein EV682_101560 [Iodobacter fluviatilis]STQ89553.1 Uncharacterised protein [Iodobacter fluviatilis]